MSRIKISKQEKNHIRNLQESDNLSDWGTQIWGTSPNNPKLQEQIETTCKPCAAGTMFTAVVQPTCGKRVKCVGVKCSSLKKYSSQSCCDDAEVGTYKKFGHGGHATCNCYQHVHMSYCK